MAALPQCKAQALATRGFYAKNRPAEYLHLKRESGRMRVLIVDDESLARTRLANLLGDSALPDLLIHQATDAPQAMALLQKERYDLLLLDIQMPGANGLALAKEIRALPQPPHIVFITAHPGHALQAFDLDAVDYLTKPVSQDRLQQALAKVHKQSAKPPMAAQPAEAAALVIHDRGRMLRLPLAQIVYFKAELKYITVRTVQNTYILDGSLNDLERDYAPDYLRIHRNALVAKRAIEAIEKHHDSEEGEGWAVRLSGVAERLAVSRRQLASVRSTLQDLCH